MQPGARTASKEKQGKPNKTKNITLDFGGIYHAQRARTGKR
jgi:hypothetical protein